MVSWGEPPGLRAGFRTGFGHGTGELPKAVATFSRELLAAPASALATGRSTPLPYLAASFHFAAEPLYWPSGSHQRPCIRVRGPIPRPGHLWSHVAAAGRHRAACSRCTPVRRAETRLLSTPRLGGDVEPCTRLVDAPGVGQQAGIVGQRLHCPAGESDSGTYGGTVLATRDLRPLGTQRTRIPADCVLHRAQPGDRRRCGACGGLSLVFRLQAGLKAGSQTWRFTPR